MIDHPQKKEYYKHIPTLMVDNHSKFEEYQVYLKKYPPNNSKDKTKDIEAQGIN